MIALKLAMGLLLVLLIVLFFLLRQNEAEEQRTTLIADVLWLEQSASFHIERNTEQLEQLAGDLAQEKNKKALFQLRSQYLLKNNPDIQQIVWLDVATNPLASSPSLNLPRLGTREVGGDFPKLAVDMAGKMGKTVYSDAYYTVKGTQFEVYAPVFENGRYQGALVCIYSFNSLLKQLVPWWFAEKYQVRILDSNGITLASKSKVGELVTAINYAIPLDPT